MVEDLAELKMTYPSQMDYSVIGQTADGRKLFEVTVGNSSADTVVLIQAGIHAREYMTCQLVMRQIEFYLAYAKDAVYHEKTVEELFQQVCFKWVPMVNPDGITISQSGLEGIKSSNIAEAIREWYQRDYVNGVTSYKLADYLKYWKANACGVDLNRNFPYGFAEFAGAKKPGAQKYKGENAGDQTEAKALMDLTEQIKPTLTISYHATGSVIYWDYGQKGALRDTCEAMVKLIASVNSNEIRYAATDKQDAAGYGDWCVMEKSIPSATIEIGVGTAPLSITEFDNIWERNALIPAALAEYALKIKH